MILGNGAYHLLKSAFADFGRNKTRTLLTSLGITIGVLSVVMLIALGLGLKNYINQQFESLGVNLIMVMPGNAFTSGGGGMQNMGSSFMGITFDEQDYLALKRVSGLDYLTPLFYKSMLIETENESKNGTIEGSNEEMFEVMKLKMEIGEVFNKSDV